MEDVTVKVIGDAKTRLVCTTAETAESSSGAAELAEERAEVLIGPQLLLDPKAPTISWYSLLFPAISHYKPWRSRDP